MNSFVAINQPQEVFPSDLMMLSFYLQKSMKEAEAKVKEVLNRNSELDAEEVELKKKCADLTRVLAEQSRFLEHKKGKLAAVEGKVRFPLLPFG